MLAGKLLGSNPEASLLLSTRMIPLAEKAKGQDELLKLILIQSDAGIRLSRYELALGHLLKGYDLAVRWEKKDAQARFLLQLGRLYWLLEDPEKSLFFYEEARKQLAAKNNRLFLQLANASCAYIRIFQNPPGDEADYQMVRDFFSAASVQPYDSSMLIQAFNLMGNVCDLRAMDVKLVEQYYQSAILLSSQTGDFYRESAFLQNLAEVFIRQGKISLARTVLEKSLNSARKINSEGLIAGSMKFLAACSAYENDYRQAFEYQVAADEIRSGYWTENQRKRSVDVLNEYNELKRRASQREAQKNLTGIRENALQSRFVLRTFSLFFVFCILLLAVWLFRINKRMNGVIRKQAFQNEQTNKLGILNQELEEKSAAADEAKKRAEFERKAKAEFLSVITHEIRTPLHAVIASAQILEQTPEMGAVALRHLEVLRFSAENLHALINNVLDFNRLEANKIQLEKQAFSMRGLLEGIQQAFMVQAMDKGIEFLFRVDQAMPDAFLGDRLRLAQVLNNLLSNAIRFTQKGAVKLLVFYDENPVSGHNLLFQVEDSGIGLDPEEQGRIRGFFEQANPGIAARFGGSGLGLAISSKILLLMDSKLMVSSEAGKGSVFSFGLNLPSTHTMFLRNHKDQSSEEDFAGCRLLFVEDVAFNRTLAGHFFDKWKIPYDFAASGAEAESLASKYAYHLIFMDVLLPDFSGFEASIRIRQLPDREKTPIIAMTALDLHEIRQKMEDAGMSDVLSKPFSAQDLKDKILKWMPVN